MASLIRAQTEPFLARYGDQITPHVRSTLQRLQFCRTAALGGHLYRCGDCQAELPVYNSCGDRHCPRCRGARRADWLDQAATVLHPSVVYFQVVFTLPEELSSIMLGNRTAGYGLLFRAAWQALKQSIEFEGGYQPAATMMLHTWNQRLGHHPHVHALVPGCGPSLDGTSWIPCRQTQGTISEPPRPFLVDNKRLGHRFRDIFLTTLRKLIQRGDIKRCADTDLAVLDELAERDWVVFVEGPPRDDSTPDQVLKYLARYMNGGPMRDRRLVSMDDDTVTFMARSLDKSNRQVPVRLTKMEFMRCWCLHILPKGLTRLRWWGGWQSTRRKSYRESCDRLAPPAEVTQVSGVSLSSTAATPNDEIPSAVADPVSLRGCPHCQGPLILVGFKVRPAWRELFYGGGRSDVSSSVSTFTGRSDAARWVAPG